MRPNKPKQYDPACFQPGRICMKIWFHKSMNQQTEDSFSETFNDCKWQAFLSRMEIRFQYEHILAHGCQNIGNKMINGSTSALKNPGIGTNYLMAMIYVKEYRNQGGVAAYKARSSKTAD